MSLWEDKGHQLRRCHTKYVTKFSLASHQVIEPSSLVRFIPDRSMATILYPAFEGCPVENLVRGLDVGRAPRASRHVLLNTKSEIATTPKMTDMMKCLFGWVWPCQSGHWQVNITRLWREKADKQRRLKLSISKASGEGNFDGRQCIQGIDLVTRDDSLPKLVFSDRWAFDRWKIHKRVHRFR